jgi:hypothetical protein
MGTLANRWRICSVQPMSSSVVRLGQELLLVCHDPLFALRSSDISKFPSAGFLLDGKALAECRFGVVFCALFVF